MKAIFAVALLSLSCSVAPVAASANDDASATLRELAVQIKQISDNAAHGQAAQAQLMAALDRELQMLHDDVSSGQTLPFDAKYRAVRMLLERTKRQVAASTLATAQHGRAELDRETIASEHGASCSKALGISPAFPVQVALGSAIAEHSDAWFLFEPARATSYVFSTDSSGADPAIAVYRDCADATPLAAADDTLGLDATVSVAVASRAPLLIHVTNSGTQGSVLLSVAAADATVAGTITDSASGQPIAFARVSLFTPSGNWVSVNNSTDSGGHYSIAVDPGTYYVLASADQHLNALYPQAPCGLPFYYFEIDNCDVAHAQTVNATSGTTVQANVALGTGQRITGTVRDDSNQPIGNAIVTLLKPNGTSLGGAYTDNFGRYQFLTLPPDTYTLRANANGFGAQFYNHVTCGGALDDQCDVNQAVPLTLASGHDLTGADFNLPVLATIHGTVGGMSPSTNANVYVWDSSGNVVAQAYVDQAGTYRAGPLPLGNYYVVLTSNGSFSLVYPDIKCAQDCYGSLGAATALSITQQGQSPAADFQLQPLPTLRGHVQDAVTGQPLANVSVLVSVQPPATFTPVNSAVTDSNGNYLLSGTPPGIYYVWALSNDHLDQVYSGIACEQVSFYSPPQAACDVTGASLLTITTSTSTLPNRDFVLQPSSSISGRATIRGGSGTIPAYGVAVTVYDLSGVPIASANTDSLGNYLVTDLAPGTYFAAVNSYYSSYVTQVWQMIDCSYDCAVTQGTPIVVSAQTAVAGIDFDVIRRDAIFGQVTNDANVPLGGVLIDLFDAQSQGYRTTAITDSQGYYLVAGSLGYSYFVATEAGSGYIDQIYSGVACPFGSAYLQLCPFTNATAISLPSRGSVQPHVVNFTLSTPPDKIFASDFE